MSARAVQFMQVWLERNDVLKVQIVDDEAILDLATRLVFDAEAAGIRDHEIFESRDDIRRGVVEKVVRRFRTRPTMH